MCRTVEVASVLVSTDGGVWSVRDGLAHYQGCNPNRALRWRFYRGLDARRTWRERLWDWFTTQRI